ncbi:MAG: hypothetical protein VYD64_03505 [Pseudomonadota bacterium]|nr:hypothetical protein [Pseudomonadota bacterium]
MDTKRRCSFSGILGAVLFLLVAVHADRQALAQGAVTSNGQYAAKISDRTYFVPGYGGSVRPMYLGRGGQGYEPVANYRPNLLNNKSYRIAGFRWSIRRNGNTTRMCRARSTVGANERRAIYCYPYEEVLKAASVEGDPFELRSFRVNPKLEALLKAKRK